MAAETPFVKQLAANGTLNGTAFFFFQGRFVFWKGMLLASLLWCWGRCFNVAGMLFFFSHVESFYEWLLDKHAYYCYFLQPLSKRKNIFVVSRFSIECFNTLPSLSNLDQDFFASFGLGFTSFFCQERKKRGKDSQINHFLYPHRNSLWSFRKTSID